MDQTCTLEGFLTRVQQRDPHQTEFAQAVREVMTTLWPFLEENPRYRQLALLERLVETGARDPVPRGVGGRPQSGPGQPRVARAVQLGHRPV